MQRYFIDIKDPQIGDMIQLSSEDTHHLVTVMRTRLGQELEIVSSEGRIFVAQVVSIASKSDPQIELLSELFLANSELPCSVTIASGLAKNDKFDWLVQKTTELGMNDFIPLKLQRNVVEWTASKVPQKTERLQKIAKGAAEQSKRLKIPCIRPLASLEEVIELSKNYDYKWVAYEEVAKKGQHHALKNELLNLKPNASIMVVFGSEGGFDKKEVDQLVAQEFLPLSLGPRILRAETAPCYLLSCISYQTEL